MVIRWRGCRRLINSFLVTSTKMTRPNVRPIEIKSSTNNEVKRLLSTKHTQASRTNVHLCERSLQSILIYSNQTCKNHASVFDVIPSLVSGRVPVIESGLGASRYKRSPKLRTDVGQKKAGNNGRKWNQGPWIPITAFATKKRYK